MITVCVRYATKIVVYGTQTVITRIILACLGVGMPALTLFTEWRGLRTGEDAYRLLAHRWAKAMGVLFAVG
ncbi:MAG TPA: cytochrome ubiquinol oxidase subunit I, partial [Pseudonocardiaceae bacterium]|nr:cytochrome ubiquinol oxidase subunit I [Pseudonocardiaceae bacterium]